MTIDLDADPSVAEPGDPVTFYYTLTNTGDYDLYNIEINVDLYGLVEEVAPDLGDRILEAGVQQTYTGSYIMGDECAYNSACVKGYNSRDRLVVRSYAGCAVMLP